MKASESELRMLLEGGKQFNVPLFQRKYSWKTKHIRQLWEDLEETRAKRTYTHFFGSFVMLPMDSFPTKVSEYLVIDGQQRLVTVFLLLSALRTRMKEIDSKCKDPEEIEQTLLTNPYHPDNEIKIVPTEPDRRAFSEIIHGEESALSDGNLISKTYNYYKRKLSGHDSLKDLRQIKDALLMKFSIVDIKLDKDDDPYLIFESLNERGTALTQADLIRNYLFMRIEEDRQKDVYDNIWLVMQERLEKHLERFIRHHLALSGDIPNINRVYSTFREMVEDKTKSQRGVIRTMRDLLKYSGYYEKFLDPTIEPAKKLRTRFERLDALGITTSYPLLLRLYDSYVSNKISRDALAECLEVVETYVVRRAVCGISTKALNKYFPTVCRSIKLKDVVQSLSDKLRSASQSRRMPDDEEFRKCLLERNLYGSKVLGYVLQRIESYKNKETVNFDDLQIEHIMPRTLTGGWRSMLGKEWELVHNKYCNRLGNLTLTGYNPEYSNKPFVKKRDMKGGFKDSGLKLNRDLAKLRRWTKKEMIQRGNRLSRTALKIWLT